MSDLMVPGPSGGRTSSNSAQPRVVPIATAPAAAAAAAAAAASPAPVAAGVNGNSTAGPTSEDSSKAKLLVGLCP